MSNSKTTALLASTALCGTLSRLLAPMQEAMRTGFAYRGIYGWGTWG